MAPLSDLNDEEIGKIFAEHALKVAAIPPRDCLPRPANLDAILDECTRNDGEVEGPVVHNFDANNDEQDDYGDNDVASTPKLPPGFIDVQGTRYHIENYLGEEWEQKCIMPLENVAEADIHNRLAVTPHPWQSIGASQMDYLCRSNFRGGICGDDMGMGKTLLAILAMDRARDEPGSFSVVVCPASCRLQWQREILAAYKQECLPKVLVLKDSQMTAHTIHAEKWDIIIVSYHLLASQYRAVQKFKEGLRMYREENGPKPSKIPIAGLLSGFWEMFDIPAKRVILDECHLIKKDKGLFYRAVSMLYHRGIIMLSGTILSNTWTDVGNLVAMLQGHPFDTREKFVQSFSVPRPKGSVSRATPDVTSLQRFLLAVLRARPSDCLSLPEVITRDAEFDLSGMEINNVSDAARKYAKALAAIAKYNPTSETATALGLAVKAQLHAAHTILGERATSTDDGITGSLEIGEDPEDFVVRLVGMHESESGQSRKEWLNELRNMNNWKLKEASRVKALLEIIRHARQTYPSEKIIVFSCFLRFLDIVNQVIKDEFEIDCLRYDGTMGSNEKERVQWAFSDSTGHSILLITSGAGGVGLNLQSASVVIQTEVWWNHNVERQAYARCVRHGQAKEVKVFRMLGSNSAIDTIILKCQLRKTKENDSIMAGLIRRHDAPLVVPEYKAGIW